MIQSSNSKILYIIGAGFSAPLGLPVMSNFISRSKDLYLMDEGRFASFRSVYDAITRLANIKNVFESDLHNIEEILSLLEMEAYMTSKPLPDFIVNYLKEVILGLTPEMTDLKNRIDFVNWGEFIFQESPLWRPYLKFISCALNLEIQDRLDNSLIGIRKPSRNSYAFISLNYDTVIETVVRSLAKAYGISESRILEKQHYDPAWSSLQIAKLHGCIEGGAIVPPTWRKGGAGDEILASWRMAYELIRNANHIRILGYSLPVSDSYIRFLLKSAIRESFDLKQIDVLVRDADESVKGRYYDFIDFSGFRFLNSSVEQLFEAINSKLVLSIKLRHNSSTGRGLISFDRLEDAHSALFE